MCRREEREAWAEGAGKHKNQKDGKERGPWGNAETEGDGEIQSQEPENVARLSRSRAALGESERTGSWRVEGRRGDIQSTLDTGLAGGRKPG